MGLADGVVDYHYRSLRGCCAGPDGGLEIDPDEAVVVRLIFACCLMGQSYQHICNGLMADGIKSVKSGETWCSSTVKSILQNEKCIGDASLRKTSSKTKIEQGKHSGKYVLSGLLVRSECGSDLTLPAVETRLKVPQEEQLELLQQAMQDTDCTEYDEKLTQINSAVTALLERKAELVRQGCTDTAYNSRVLDIINTLDQMDSAITEFDAGMVYQTTSSIKILDQAQISVRFKDGTEIEQEWHSGRVHVVRPHVLHLMRGQVFHIDGLTWLTMGGAASHDIQNGILNPAAPDFERRYWAVRRINARFRVLGKSWWPQEKEGSRSAAAPALRNGG